jgi:hypothetical protein
MTENKDSFNYTHFFIGLGIFFAILIAVIFVNMSYESKFGKLSSYYLPIFSFGKIDFPPLEF